MNKALFPASTADAKLFTSEIWSTVLFHTDDPASGEAKVVKRVRDAFYRDHPELRMAEEQIKETQARHSHLHGQRERHLEAMRDGELMGEKHVGAREGVPTLFDRVLFFCVVFIGIGGNLVALTNTATYVADSGAIASLTGNFWGALFLSTASVSGAALIKAMGALQIDSKAERAFYLKIADFAGVIVLVHIIALSVVFAPHKIDTVALQEALANGIPPANPVVTFIQSVASDLMLATALIAETLIAPIVLHYAQKMQHAGRKITVDLHHEQIFHSGRINEINSKIKENVEQLSQSEAVLDRYMSAIAESTEAALRLYREMVADLQLEEKRARQAFIAKRSRRGSQ